MDVPALTKTISTMPTPLPYQVTFFPSPFLIIALCRCFSSFHPTMISPSQRWQYIVVGVIVVSTLLLFSDSFLEQPYRSSLVTKGKSENTPSPPWLIATISAAQSVQRRAIIRSTWQTLYKNDTMFTTRFVLANPGELWSPVIAAENATYGDLIILSDLKEDAYMANTIKSIEFLKYLTTGNTSYDFVTKIDEDSYLDAHNFWKTYLQPRIVSDAQTIKVESSALTRTIIARTLRRSTWTFPGGQFYTMTWDLAVLLSQLHAKHPIIDEYEDVLVGRLLHEAQVEWQHIDLPNEIAFDFEEKNLRGDGTAFAKDGADLNGWKHGVARGSVNPHKMKEDEEYLRVAACFDEKGVILNPAMS